MGPRQSVTSGDGRRYDSGRRSGVVKLQHYIGGLEGLPEPLSLEPLSVDKRVFVEDWEKRIFGRSRRRAARQHRDQSLG